MAFSGLAIAAYAASTGYAIYSGEKAAAQQKKALSNQQAAQNQAEVAALSQRRRAEMATAAANRKQPDIAGLLDFEQNLTGAATTDLQAKRKQGSLLGDA